MRLFFWPLRIAVFLLSIPVFSQTSAENFVLSRTYRVRGGVVSSGTKYWGNPDQVRTAVNYLDGLGKAKQSIVVAGTPKKRDIVSISRYNSMHELERQYLPAAMSVGKGDYNSTDNVETFAGAYYNATNKVGDPTSTFWTETIYDKSPLNRVKNQKAPGVTTGGRSNYRTNYSLPNSVVFVRAYRAIGNNELEELQDPYAEGTLNIVESLDEDGKKVEEFTDRNGRVILKKVAGEEDTYYVFNEKGQLRYVLQPQYQVGNAPEKLAKYAFQYTYDDRGRVITKRVPGQGLFRMKYYPTDMLKYLVDGKGQCFYYDYDNLNRQTEMGIVLINNTDSTRKALLKTKYDNYSGIESGFGFVSANAFQGQATWPDDDGFLGNPVTDPKKGLITQTQARVLDGSASENSWVTTVFYYDKKGRAVQKQKNLYGLGSDAREQISYQYDFVGNVVREHTAQKVYTTVYHSEKVYTYDHQNRQKSVVHKFYPDPDPDDHAITYTQVANTYNDLGLLEKKSLHNGKQDLTYRYTPRGWLYDIKNTAGKTYLLDLRYNANGNISSLGWKTNGFEGSFSSISYDGSNRLTSAVGTRYEESGISYDRNGNILKLKRKRDGITIDDLSYHDSQNPNATTSYNGNQLMRVIDSGTTEGFNNANSADSVDYVYDGNGNLIKDRNKAISEIIYNVLNLPKTVNMWNPKRTIQYVYDGAGNKLMVTSPSMSTIYAGAFEYNPTGELLRLGLEEGQLVASEDGYVINYYLRDHLGNVRMVIDQQGGVLQETEYYAFGMPVTKTGTDEENKYLYNGKEKQAEIGTFDFHTRLYDPSIARGFKADPMSENYYSRSPYGWVLNNPLKLVDPTGMFSTHTDAEGNVVAVFDDGDLGIYRHEEGATEESVKQQHSEDNTSAGGELMGESLHMYSFVNHTIYNESGGRTLKGVGKIDFGVTWAHDQVAAVLRQDPSAYEYAKKAGHGGVWDLKMQTPLDRDGTFGSIIGNGANGPVYASARDAGNFLAGAVASRSSFPTSMLLRGFGAYNLGGSKAVGAVIFVGSEAASLLTGFNFLGNLPGKGEDPLSYKAIVEGVSRHKTMIWDAGLRPGAASGWKPSRVR